MRQVGRHVRRQVGRKFPNKSSKSQQIPKDLPRKKKGSHKHMKKKDCLHYPRLHRWGGSLTQDLVGADKARPINVDLSEEPPGLLPDVQ